MNTSNTPTPLQLSVAAIATWRLSHMFLKENGPFRVFRQGREALGVVYDPVDEDFIVSARYEITTCIWCLSMWVGAFTALGLWLSPSLTTKLLLPYVFSAFAATWDRVLGGLK